MKNSPSCGCCFCERCRIAFDDFDRSDSDNPGARYSEESGDWDISSNELVTTSTDAVLYLTDWHPYGYAFNVITVSVKGEDAGDEIDVLTGIDGNDHWVRVRLTLQDGSTCGTLAIHEVLAAAEDALITVVVPDAVEDEWHKVKVCHLWDVTTYSWRVFAEVTTSSGKKTTASALGSLGGNRIGLGTGTISTRAHFDDWCWQRQYTNVTTYGFGPDPACPKCGSSCLFSEDYVDAVGTDLGCAWFECSGDWEIEDSGGGELAITIDSAPAVLLHQVSQPYNNPEQRIVLDIKVEDTGDTVQVLICTSLCASSIGCGIELEAGATCGIMRIMDGGSQLGDDIPVQGLIPDQWHHVEVCVGSAYAGNVLGTRNLTASVTPSGGRSHRITADVSSNAGTLAKLATVSLTSKAWFRDIQRQLTYIEDLVENCDTCDGREIWCVWGYLTCDSSEACYWTDVSGSWTCGTTSSDDAFKRFEFPQPRLSNRQRIAGTVTMSGDAEAIAYLAWVDATQYMALRITTGGACPTVELIEDGVVLRTVQDHRIVADAAIDFCLMFDGTELSAWYLTPQAVGEEIYLEALATGHESGGLPLGLKAGIGTGTVTSGTVAFSNVELFVAKTAIDPTCEDCDECTTWYDNDFSGTLNDPLSCDYDGTATYDNVYEYSGGVNIDVAKIPAAGSMAVDVGADGSGIVYISFVLMDLPATITVTAFGIVSTLEVEADTIAELICGDSGATATIVVADLLYTLKICAFGTSSAANLLGGGISSSLLASAHGDGTASGNTVTIEAAENPVYVKTLYVTRRLKNDTTENCGTCYTACEPCEDNIMPGSLLIEIEDCVDSFYCSDCCDDCVSTGTGIAGAFYVPMVGCVGGYFLGTIVEGGCPRTLNVQLNDMGDNIQIDVFWYIQNNYPDPGIYSYWRSALIEKPFNCQAINRVELTQMASIGNAFIDPYIAGPTARCYVSSV